MQDRAPRRVGDYQLLEQLGEGGMGAVWRARHRLGGREVAIKLLHSELAEAEELERFRREAEAVRGLRHPNVVQVVEAGVSRGRPFIAFELVEGRSLAARINSTGPLAPEEAAALVAELCLGLAAVHARGVLHRDLKPQNVMLTRDGRPLLADFGLAKAASSLGQSLTQTGTILGTPSYMAPEQAQGLRRIDARADVYGLGAVLYHCLTGQPPFKQAGGVQTLRAVLEDPPRPPCSLRPGIPSWLEDVCLRCLDKDPSRRFATPGALATALRGHQSSAPPGNRTLALAAGILGVALLVASALVASAPPQTVPSRSGQVSPSGALTGPIPSPLRPSPGPQATVSSPPSVSPPPPVRQLTFATVWASLQRRELTPAQARAEIPGLRARGAASEAELQLLEARVRVLEGDIPGAIEVLDSEEAYPLLVPDRSDFSLAEMVDGLFGALKSGDYELAAAGFNPGNYERLWARADHRVVKLLDGISSVLWSDQRRASEAAMTSLELSKRANGLRALWRADEAVELLRGYAPLTREAGYLYQLGGALREAGEREDAIETFRQIRALTPSDLREQRLRAEALRNLKEMGAAE